MWPYCWDLGAALTDLWCWELDPGLLPKGCPISRLASDRFFFSLSVTCLSSRSCSRYFSALKDGTGLGWSVSAPLGSEHHGRDFHSRWPSRDLMERCRGGSGQVGAYPGELWQGSDSGSRGRTLGVGVTVQDCWYDSLQCRPRQGEAGRLVSPQHVSHLSMGIPLRALRVSTAFVQVHFLL